jgi:hypothetical protein
MPVVASNPLGYEILSVICLLVSSYEVIITEILSVKLFLCIIYEFSEFVILEILYF